MKTKPSANRMFLLSAAALAVAGCQQTRLIFHPVKTIPLRQGPVLRQSRAVLSPVARQSPAIPSPVARQSPAIPSPVARQSPAVLSPVARQSRAVPSPVSLAAMQNDPKTEPTSTNPPNTDSAAGKTAERPPEPIVVQKSVPVAYTAPPAWVRQLVVLVGSIGLTQGPSDTEAGKEISESLVHSAAGVTGRLGLTGPPTIVGGAVVGRQGLQNNSLAAIGFGSRNNIQTLQRNPATGPGGRCSELISAGFNPNHSACPRGARRR